MAFFVDNFLLDLKILVPGRSNRRPDGAQPCKQHSDGLWARSAVSTLAPRRQPRLAGDCGVWHGKKVLA
ncbi:hypothetical protein EQH89_04630 [Lacticaseibacillus paracasei]|nr:hypothetical protein EQH89_04630 [Lacticaseibacillus paracasei]